MDMGMCGCCAMGDKPTAPHAKHAFDTDVVAGAVGGSGDDEAAGVPSLCQSMAPSLSLSMGHSIQARWRSMMRAVGVEGGASGLDDGGWGRFRGADWVAGLFVWGTADSTVAYLESMLEEGGGALPRHFSRSVYSSVVSIMAIHFKIHGPCETLAFATDPVRGRCGRARRQLLRVRAGGAGDGGVGGAGFSRLCAGRMRRAVGQLGQQEYRRYADGLGYGAVAVGVGREETGGFCLVNPEEVREVEVKNLPFAMDGALGFVAELLSGRSI